LTLEESLILEWFRKCQTQWNRVGGFSGERRVGIPFTDALAAAELIGLRLNYSRFRMFLDCVEAIVNDDIETINASG
jgi:hypothetical protein